MLGVSTYGGGLWHTWFDRDLSLAGRVFVFNNSTKKTEERLVDFEESLLRVPNLAIHLDRSVNEGFKFNTELHLAPILSNCVANDLDNSSIYSLIQEKLGLSSHEEIIELELSLYDTQGPVVSGLGKEFLHSARLDNLLMSFTALASLSESEGIEEETGVRIICLFDHEEVGSQSAVGADSNFLMEILGRLFDGKRGLEVALKKSFLVSADVAHAIHPNYGDKHEPNHAPRMNQGLVIKFNPNQRYMTNGLSAAYFKSLSKELLEEQNKSSVKKFVGCQDFIVKNDSPCGSTIGPFLASKTGILTIDVGIPVLSMHSIREMMGVDDLDTTIMLFKKFFTKPL